MSYKQNQNDIVSNILKNEYIKRVELIYNITQHIEILCSDHIISQNENSRYMKILNDITKVLNLLYNDIIKAIKDVEKIEEDLN